MSHPTRLAATCGSMVLLATMATAQTRVLPPTAATTDGLTEFPLYAMSQRLQQIWTGTGIAANSATIRQIAYRADAGPLPLPNPANQLLSAVARVGAVTTPVGRMSPMFQANIGTSRLTTVFQGTIRLPAGGPKPAPARASH